jgi:hypothetical protein
MVIQVALPGPLSDKAPRVGVPCVGPSVNRPLQWSRADALSSPPPRRQPGRVYNGTGFSYQISVRKPPGGGRRHAAALHGFSPILGAVGLINWTGLPIAAVENSNRTLGHSAPLYKSPLTITLVFIIPAFSTSAWSVVALSGAA